MLSGNFLRYEYIWQKHSTILYKLSLSNSLPYRFFFFNYLKLIVVLLVWYTINFDNKISIYARSTLNHVSGSKIGLSKKKVAARLSIKEAKKKKEKKEAKIKFNPTKSEWQSMNHEPMTMTSTLLGIRANKNSPT